MRGQAPLPGLLPALPQARIDAALRQQRLMPALFGQPALLEHEDLVGIFHGGEPVRHQQHGFAFHQL